MLDRASKMTDADYSRVKADILDIEVPVAIFTESQERIFWVPSTHKDFLVKTMFPEEYGEVPTKENPCMEAHPNAYFY